MYKAVEERIRKALRHHIHERYKTDVPVVTERPPKLAMGEVAARLGLGDAYVIFGHTHRAGPLPGDREQEWRGRSAARLINAGSWAYTPVFLTKTVGESPYWPGRCVLLEDSGPHTNIEIAGESD